MDADGNHDGLNQFKNSDKGMEGIVGWGDGLVPHLGLVRGMALVPRELPCGQIALSENHDASGARLHLGRLLSVKSYAVSTVQAVRGNLP